MSRVEQIGGVRVGIINDSVPVRIYALRAPGSDIALYVGSTSRLIRDRIRAHIADAMKGSPLPVHKWLRSCAGGFDVAILEVVDESSRHDAEGTWIERLQPKLNITNGGPGMSGHRFAGTEHAKRIAAAIRSGGHFNCNRCGKQFWRKRNEIAKGNNKYCSRSCSNSRRARLADAA